MLCPRSSGYTDTIELHGHVTEAVDEEFREKVNTGPVRTTERI